MRRTCLPAAVCLVGLALHRPAAAQDGGNLLVNGDFTAGLGGYTVTASPGYLVSTTNECSLRGPSGGIRTCAVFGTPGTGTGGASLSQEITTAPGATYVASFVTGIKPLRGGFDVFLAAAGQQVAVDCVGVDFCVVTLPFTATAQRTTVSLGVRGYVPAGAPPLFQSGTFVGDASVRSLATVPEPAPVALLGGALAVLGGVVVRRRAAST
jgi:hypothetical protein